MTALLLGFPEYAAQARALAQAAGLAHGEIDIHHFPDGESRVRLPPALPDRVVLVRSLNAPNDKLVELLLAAATARELGARHLTLVAPYLCYMRQDTAFHAGEAVSQRIVGRWLAEHFDRLVTVDPHLHRTPELGAAVPVTQPVRLSAAALIGRAAAENYAEPVLLGPDAESAQWVSEAAAAAGSEWGVATKVRRGDREVAIRLPERSWQGRTVVLVDDVAASGMTLARTAEALHAAGATQVHAMVTHALFDAETERLLHEAGIADIASTDSVPHPSNRLSLAPLLAPAVTA
ncbi:ribose-phosphate diphosphokinase [Thiohalobacter sp.]|uniref:ribose-phosphate diphosphokinase n=1 Tax=Thiohalobacter sp. TaxID=2025948 RepID=UPI00260B24B8|nr:ribose-phosphate diphosphokinase [Thiohalobacter sp.]